MTRAERAVGQTEPSSVTATQDKPEVLFTLVHGTFAKGAPWVTGKDDTSGFRDRLKAELESDYDVRFDDSFTWGGDRWRILDNTAAARLAGGRALARHLTQPADRDPTLHFIVAHSHGGNVALYASKHARVRRAIDGLICLATPFLFSEPKPFPREVLGFSALLLVLFTVGEAKGLGLLWAVPLWIYTALVAVVTVIIIVGGYRRLTDEEKVIEGVERLKTQLMDLSFPTREDFSGKDGSPTLAVIRVESDEVGGLMRLAYRLGGWVRRAWGLVNRFGGLFLVVYIFTVYPVRLVQETIEFKADWLETAAVLFDKFLMTPLLLLATVVLMAMVVLRCCFAFDSPRWIASFDTRSEETPWPKDGPQPIRVPLDPSTRGWLRHTKIQGPAAVEIAKLVRDAEPVE